MKRILKMRLHRWAWLLVILLVACAPVTPVAIPAGEGDANAGEAAAPESTEEPTAEAAATPESMAEAAAPAFDDNNLGVAILVVDFFGTPGEESENPNNNCLAGPNGSTSTSEGAGSHGSSGATNNLVTTDVPHGELVYTHLLQLIPTGTTFTDITPSNSDGLLLAEVGTIPQGELYLAKVDIGSNLTITVLNQIDAVRSYLQGQGADYFVVNMSVVIKPCGNVAFESAEEYAQFIACIPSLAAARQLLLDSGVDPDAADEQLLPQANIAAAYYVDPTTRQPLGCPAIPEIGVGNVPEILVGVQQRSESFMNRMAEEALLLATQDGDGNATTEDTFFVAASGNDGYDYPYAPAIFRQVVSVGTEVVEDLGYTPNRAEWVLSDHFDWEVPPGATVEVAEGGGAVTPRSAGERVPLSGTSFATPKLSYLTALALLDGSTMPACYPHMVYAANDLPVNWFDWPNPPSGTPLIAVDVWKNWPLTELLPNCPTFPLP